MLLESIEEERYEMSRGRTPIAPCSEGLAGRRSLFASCRVRRRGQGAWLFTQRPYVVEGSTMRSVLTAVSMSVGHGPFNGNDGFSGRAFQGALA